MTPTWMQARELLRDITPLKQDCGHLCRGACCAPLNGQETGMLLFPGEEAFYRSLPGYRIVSSPAGDLLICSGRCDRSQRPLSCMIFPLLPLLRGDEIKVAMDARALSVCPLYSAGRSGLCDDFVQAVRKCGQILAADPEERAFLQKLTQAHDDLRELQHAFQEGPNVSSNEH